MTTDQITDPGYELITEVEHLHFYLKQALRLEHATIPPYITALYSLKPGTNLEAFHIIRAVAVEEMLHLTLVANLLNAVGGDIKSTLTHPDFVPKYPAYIPTGARDFQVHLRKFSPETVENFMQIERAEEVEEGKPLVVSRFVQERDHFLTIHNGEKSNTFYSIGLFYSEIIRGLFALNKKMGSDELFCGDPERQITPAYYYNGGGDIIPVTDLRSAMRAMRVIQEQGEGSRVRTIYDAERELAHYYRFHQLVPSDNKVQLGEGKYYVIDKDNPEKSDSPGQPTGASFKVDWDAVYPLKENASLSDYCEGTEVYAAAQEFESAYRIFLEKLEDAFNGNPAALIPAVGGMFRLKEQANSLIRNPIRGMDGDHAAPIFPVAPPNSAQYPEPIARVTPQN
ncbi:MULTISPECIES: ferritin-like protein [unclassified Microcoleus]|uniref:ferritin-like domain-containing protein n=1 Tax=unclassified Microcoleus TaxID=2642155 RepID=UPI0025FE13BF|nr:MULTISPECIES: ferritin-like protein [unclassified Microcoleus]